MLIPNETLGKNIAHHRKSLKLSKAKLATIAGMSSNHLWCIESGRVVPGIITLARLAAALGVPIDELANDRRVET